MNLVDLKTEMLNKQLDDRIQFTFHCENDYYLADQYIEEIAHIKGLDIIYVDEIPTDSMIEYLFVVKTTKPVEGIMSSVNYIQCYVGEKELEGAIFFPKLESWQLADYVKVKAPELMNISNELVNVCKDPYRLDNELKKINCFASANKQSVAEYIIDNSADLTNTTIFDISNYIIRKKFNELSVLYTKEMDINPITLVSLLIKNFKLIISIQLNSKATADSLGISYRQFKAIQYSCGYYKNDELITLYNMLLSIDEKIKEGKINTDILLDYVIMNTIGV